MGSVRYGWKETLHLEGEIKKIQKKTFFTLVQFQRIPHILRKSKGFYNFTPRTKFRVKFPGLCNNRGTKCHGNRRFSFKKHEKELEEPRLISASIFSTEFGSHSNSLCAEISVSVFMMCESSFTLKNNFVTIRGK